MLQNHTPRFSEKMNSGSMPKERKIAIQIQNTDKTRLKKVF
jgi:hypothetical protein